MYVVGILVIILNFFDAVCTTAGVSQGIVVELNPLLREMYILSPVATFLSKVVLVPTGVIFVIYRGAGKRWVLVGLVICLLVYLWACGLHFLWLNQLFLL